MNKAERELAASYKNEDPEMFGGWKDEDVIKFNKEGEFADPDFIERYKIFSSSGVEKPGIIESGKAALKKADDLGTSFNKSVDAIADVDKNDQPGDSYQPHDMGDAAIILGAKALRKTGEVGKAVGEGADATIDAIDKKIDDNLPWGVSHLTKIHPLLQGPKMAYRAASMLAPRTSMQAAFAALTAYTDIKAAGSAINAVGKTRLAGAAASKADKTTLGATRKVGEMFPESKLANMLDEVTQGSVGEQAFNIENKSAVNTSERILQKEGLEAAEEATLEGNLGQIKDKLKHDVSEIVSTQNALEESEKKARLSALDTATPEQQALRKEVIDRQAQIKALAAEKNHAAKMAEAREAAIKADLAVDEAIGLANKDLAASSVGRIFGSAKYKAEKAVSVLYEKTRALGKLVVADTSALNESFGSLKDELLEKLKVNPEDVRAQNILAMLEYGTDTLKHISEEGLDAIRANDTLPQTTKKVADKMVQKKSKTLADLMDLYSDLNGLARDKGDRVYKQAKRLVRQEIRKHEDIPWTKAVIDSWDAARGAQTRMSVAYENKTLEGLLKVANEGHPGTLFKKLVESGADSTMPLTRFMEVAPEGAKNIVRRESLGRAYESVQNAKPGEALKALDDFIEKTGQGNVEILHGGLDLDGLKKLAEFRDTVANIEKTTPEIAKQIKTTQKAITKIVEDTVGMLKSSREKVSKAKNSAWDAQHRLKESARASEVAELQASITRIENGIKAIDAALPVQVKESSRAGEVGRKVITGLRSDDDGSTKSITGGLGMIGVGYGLKAMGMTQMGYVTGGIGVAAVVHGLNKKAPRAMSQLYYSQAGRALMKKIASAPSARDAAMGLIELADAIKKPGAYAIMRPNMNDKNPEKQPEGKYRANLGKLSGLQARTEEEGAVDPFPEGNYSPEELQAVGLSGPPGVKQQEEAEPEPEE